jgi:hypothetical protein
MRNFSRTVTPYPRGQKTPVKVDVFFAIVLTPRRQQAAKEDEQQVW